MVKVRRRVYCTGVNALIFCASLFICWHAWGMETLGDQRPPLQTSKLPFGQNAPELAQLRDIHSPDVIGWWPLAPGWYLLAIVLIVALMTVIFFLGRHYLNGRARRQALRLLVMYQQQYQREKNSQLTAARTSELLKRVALVYFPREKVASLQGDAWIHFLNATAKGLNFNTVRQELLETPYQSVIDRDLQPLLNMARMWINQRRGACLN